MAAALKPSPSNVPSNVPTVKLLINGQFVEYLLNYERWDLANDPNNNNWSGWRHAYEEGGVAAFSQKGTSKNPLFKTGQ